MVKMPKWKQPSLDDRLNWNRPRDKMKRDGYYPSNKMMKPQKFLNPQNDSENILPQCKYCGTSFKTIREHMDHNDLCKKRKKIKRALYREKIVDDGRYGKL